METTKVEQVTQVIQLLGDVAGLLEEIKQDRNLPLVLTVEQAAEKLQISVPTFRRNVLIRPDFPKIRIGAVYRIPTNALIRWLEEKGIEREGAE